MSGERESWAFKRFAIGGTNANRLEQTVVRVTKLSLKDIGRPRRI